MGETMILNEFVELRNSKIHNKGIFAITTIPKGTKIIEYVGEKINKEESKKRAEEIEERAKLDPSKGAIYLFELNDDWDLDGDTEDNYAKYINHSCDPNCESDIVDDRIWIYAIKEISKGEELSFNYGLEMDENYHKYPCKCGSLNCVGYILAEEEWPKLKNSQTIKTKEDIN